MKRLKYLCSAAVIVTLLASAAWAAGPAVILDYDPAEDTVGAMPANAGGVTGDTYTDRFSTFSREGGAGVSEIQVSEDETGSAVRFYSTDAYTSGNHNVYLTKKLDLTSGKIAVSTRIKGFNPQTSSAEYSGRKMFPQICLKSAETTKKNAIFTMYNGVGSFADVGGGKLAGVIYENEWHDVTLVLENQDGKSSVTVNYYYDGTWVGENTAKMDATINPANALLTFGAHFRSGGAECFYGPVKIYRQSEQAFSLGQTENVKLNENLALQFQTQLNPELFDPSQIRISSASGDVPVESAVLSQTMDGVAVTLSKALAAETEYTVSVSDAVDIFGETWSGTQNFRTGKAVLSLGDVVLKHGEEPIEKLESGPLRATVQADNQTGQNYGVTLVAALYRGGEMVQISCSPYTELTAGESVELAVDLMAGDLSAGGYTMQVYCINDVLRLGAFKRAAVFTQ